MTDEDISYAKLKGWNAIIKFTDGEELFIFIDGFNGSEEDYDECLASIDEFLNGDSKYFPSSRIAVKKEAIKYVMKI